MRKEKAAPEHETWTRLLLNDRVAQVSYLNPTSERYNPLQAMVFGCVVSLLESWMARQDHADQP